MANLTSPLLRGERGVGTGPREQSLHHTTSGGRSCGRWTANSSGSEPLEAGETISSGLPGLRAGSARELARENRRRTRQGLPRVEGEVVASARGWDEPETPSANSLAERFVRERRQTLGRTGDDVDPNDSLDGEDLDDREL